MPAPIPGAHDLRGYQLSGSRPKSSSGVRAATDPVLDPSNTSAGPRDTAVTGRQFVWKHPAGTMGW
jgi:hypothetical protein